MRLPEASSPCVVMLRTALLGTLIVIGSALHAHAAPDRSSDPLSGQIFSVVSNEVAYEARFEEAGGIEVKSVYGRFAGVWMRAGDLLCIDIPRSPLTGRTCTAIDRIDGGTVYLANGTILDPLARILPAGSASE